MPYINFTRLDHLQKCHFSFPHTHTLAIKATLLCFTLEKVRPLIRLSVVRRGKLFLLLLVKISHGCRQQVDYVLIQSNSHQCTLQQCLITQPVYETSLSWPTHMVKCHQGLVWNLLVTKPRFSRTLREPSLIPFYIAPKNAYYHLWLIWVYPFSLSSLTLRHKPIYGIQSCLKISNTDHVLVKSKS